MTKNQNKTQEQIIKIKMKNKEQKHRRINKHTMQKQEQ
jgi:hypothetical protein